MFGNAPRSLPQRLGFVMVPQVTQIALVGAVEALRLANRASGRALYAWQIMSLDAAPVTASNGMVIAADSGLEEAADLDVIVVCGGADPALAADRRLLAWLRTQARRGRDLGSLCTGSLVLAKAGLLDGYRCTIHWENVAGFVEAYPHIDVSTELFEIDRGRFTCAGGTAVIDLMLNLIGRQHGHELAAKVADQFMHERIRDSHDHQRMSLPARLGVRHPKLLAIIDLMESNLEEPLSRNSLAEHAGLSARQLERLFRKYLNRSPARYYLELRLNRARLLLLQTDMSVIDVALACGFVSASHFSKCYRDSFGHTPRRERGVPASALVS
ncbi:MAG: GlxA family transcriptional regulator [Rhodospirillales bacterium]